jgi:hypothetical protein
MSNSGRHRGQLFARRDGERAAPSITEWKAATRRPSFGPYPLYRIQAANHEAILTFTAQVGRITPQKRRFRNRLDHSLSLALIGNISSEALGVDASTRKAQSIGSELSAMKRPPRGG